MQKWIFLVFLLIAGVAFGQTNSANVRNLLDQGDELFGNNQYINAVRFYKEALVEDAGNLKAQYQLAECYRLVQDYESAEYYY